MTVSELCLQTSTEAKLEISRKSWKKEYWLNLMEEKELC